MRFLVTGVGAVLILCATYYAGFRSGERRVALRVNNAARPDTDSPSKSASRGEASRVVPVANSSLESISREDYDALMARDLMFPLEGVKVSNVHDTFNQGRASGKHHEATDIMAPRGTPIHAVQDGAIRKLFFSKAGGNTIYEFDPDGVYCFYYAHLDRYADGLHEGMPVKKGDVIGYVGSTGDASPDAPHLHFAISKLGPDKKWWQGTAINPYPILVQLAQR